MVIINPLYPKLLTNIRFVSPLPPSSSGLKWLTRWGVDTESINTRDSVLEVRYLNCTRERKLVIAECDSKCPGFECSSSIIRFARLTAKANAVTVHWGWDICEDRKLCLVTALLTFTFVSNVWNIKGVWPVTLALLKSTADQPPKLPIVHAHRVPPSIFGELAVTFIDDAY